MVFAYSCWKCWTRVWYVLWIESTIETICYSTFFSYKKKIKEQTERKKNIRNSPLNYNSDQNVNKMWANWKMFTETKPRMTNASIKTIDRKILNIAVCILLFSFDQIWIFGKATPFNILNNAFVLINFQVQ